MDHTVRKPANIISALSAREIALRDIDSTGLRERERERERESVFSRPSPLMVVANPRTRPLCPVVRPGFINHGTLINREMLPRNQDGTKPFVSVPCAAAAAAEAGRGRNSDEKRNYRGAFASPNDLIFPLPLPAIAHQARSNLHVSSPRLDFQPDRFVSSRLARYSPIAFGRGKNPQGERPILQLRYLRTPTFSFLSWDIFFFFIFFFFFLSLRFEAAIGFLFVAKNSRGKGFVRKSLRQQGR